MCLQNKGGERGGKRSGEAARASHSRGARKGAGAAGARRPRPSRRCCGHRDPGTPRPSPSLLPSAQSLGDPDPTLMNPSNSSGGGGVSHLFWMPFAPQTTHFGKRPPRSREREPGGRPRGGGARGRRKRLRTQTEAGRPPAAAGNYSSLAQEPSQPRAASQRPASGLDATPKCMAAQRGPPRKPEASHGSLLANPCPNS